MDGSRRGDTYYKDLLDSLLEGCQILGRDWRYRYLNAAAEVHNRRPNSELIGNEYTAMWPGVSETEVYRVIRDCMENRVPRYMENEFVFPDGTSGWFELRITPVPEGVFIMSLDITPRKLAEHNLREMEDQLRQSQKLEAVGQLAGGVAHDFNNIIGVIMGHAEMALANLGANDPLRDDLSAILSAAGRSAELTRQLLAFARKQVNAPRVVELNQAVDGVLKLLHRLLGEDVTLRWVPEEGSHKIRIDPSQLEQILTNLCVNARDAIGGVGALTLESRTVVITPEYCESHPGFRPGDFIVLSVSDTGAGMDAETIQRIFEPFFTTKALGHGTGLGLSIVYGIVKQNEGFINVYSEPDRGTTFRIYFRRADEGVAAAPAVVAVDYLSRGHETILVVEDEPSLRQLVTRMLDDLGYHVLSADSPESALKLVREYRGTIHALFSDVIMPGMTGPQLLAEVDRLLPGTPCLYTSGYTANVIAHRGVLDPNVHFLSKPFSRKELGAKLLEVLAERAPGAPD